MEVAGAERWLLKSLFIKESRVHGLERIAEEYGEGLAQWEWKALVDALESDEVREIPPDGPAADRLRTALTELRESGYEPSLVIVPYDWQTYQALGLTPAPNLGGDAVSPEWLDEANDRPSFIGAVDGIPVVQQQHVADRNVYVFDIGRFARFRARGVDDPPGPVIVEIAYYDNERLQHLVHEGRVPFDEGLDEAEKVRILQQQVNFNAIYPFEIQVLDPAAARRLRVEVGAPEE